MDADYPDMPLGGWAGTIAEVHGDGMYTAGTNTANSVGQTEAGMITITYTGLDAD